jgi:hypothetical protein
MIKISTRNRNLGEFLSPNSSHSSHIVIESEFRDFWHGVRLADKTQTGHFRFLN